MVAEDTDLMIYTKGRLLKSCRQLTQNLLCDECENKFGKAEDYFAKIAMPSKNTYEAPVLFRVLNSTLIPLWNQMGISSVSFGAGFYSGIINSKAIYYYALSLFWRAGQDGWNQYEKLSYQDGLMELMREFLMGGGYIPGYVVRVYPSLWKEKYSFVFPHIFRKQPFFSVYMYDFYLEKSVNFFRFSENFDMIPIFYSADNTVSVSSYCAMKKMISTPDSRASVLNQDGDLISW